MKVLIIGSGGREHALAWRFAQEGWEVAAAPGNPGIETFATCLPGSDYSALAHAMGVDLTVVGPEAPLVAGVVDTFRKQGKLICGPTQAAARLEGSKQFAKRIMIAAGVPTARYRDVSDPHEARRAADDLGYPVVIKADGLAAGKGVVVADDREHAYRAIEQLQLSLGPHLVIEEFLSGEEVSFIVLSDGRDVLPLDASQDHKAVFDDDQGPNTGGMGAYCDGRLLTAAQTDDVMIGVIRPLVDYMASQGNAFTGFLYAGLMLTPDGPKVLEFNVRLGDPETQCLLHRIQGGFAEAVYAAAQGNLVGRAIQWRPEPSVCVVMAAEGYPAAPRTGEAISGVDQAEATGATVFHAGTRYGPNGLETAGGRVLGVTARGTDLADAIRCAYDGVARIRFRGAHYRTDIGKKGLKRWYNQLTAGT